MACVVPCTADPWAASLLAPHLERCVQLHGCTAMRGRALSGVGTSSRSWEWGSAQQPASGNGSAARPARAALLIYLSETGIEVGDEKKKVPRAMRSYAFEQQSFGGEKGINRPDASEGVQAGGMGLGGWGMGLVDLSLRREREAEPLLCILSGKPRKQD